MYLRVRRVHRVRRVRRVRGDVSPGAEQPPVLNGNTTIGDHRDTVITGSCFGRAVVDAKLQPDRRHVTLDRLADVRADELRAAEHIHQIDVERNRGEVGVCLLAQHFAKLRIDRHDAIPLALQIARDGVARPVRVGTEAHHRDSFCLAQQPGYVLIGHSYSNYLNAKAQRRKEFEKTDHSLVLTINACRLCNEN